NSVTSQVVEVTTQSTVETVSKEDTIKRDEDAYLNDAVFIGDSITEGLKFYLGALDTKILSAKSLNPDTIFTAKVDCPDGEKRTILKGLETIEFSKVYILIGTNGIAFMEKNYMISQLSKFIDDIKKIKPNCAIYLQSMTPVTKKKYESDNRFSLENISQYNLQLKELSLKKQIYYLDINSLFSGQDGYLPSDQSPDGIHFYKNQYKTWYEFILTHTDRVFQFKT
ncbi:MAG: GDSL-type esterase/lipase family protein, partial [Clostridia bacterium]